MCYVGAALLIVIGLAHSYLGERYILIRLFKRGELPKLFGGTEFTKNTLRFAWHLTTVAWWGFAAILMHLAHSPPSTSLLGSKGKHFSWVFFLIIGLTTIYASNV